MRILVLTPYFPPEVGAPQSRLYELSVRLARRGHEVTVLTGFPNYPTGIIPEPYRGRRRMNEEMDGVKVVRTWLYATPNKGFLKRILNHLSFMLSSMWTGLFTGPADVIFVESPPLFDGVAGAFLSAIKRAPMIFNVADLWPRSAVELGAVKNPLLIKLAELLEVWIYKRSAGIAAVTRGIERELRERGFEQTFFLPNGVDVSVFQPDRSGDAFRTEQGLGDRFIVLYTGTHGMAQGLETVVEAARGLQDREDIAFVLIGDGSERDRLMREAEGLSNIRFLGTLPKARIPEAVAAADAYVVTLKDLPLFRGAVPSKLYEAMAMAKPVVLAVRGEAEELLCEAEAGICVAPEDPVALAEAVVRLAGDRPLAERLGRGGRALVEARYDREALAERLESILLETRGHVSLRRA